MKKTALYPGCSLEGTANSYLVSLEKTLAALGVECGELRQWNCCGATSAHAMDHDLYLALAMRNLALAESQGYGEVLAPCAACYHRLASANAEFSGVAGLLERLNRDADLAYAGKVKVRNVLDFLDAVLGLDRIRSRVTRSLSGLKAACYYGCLNTRVSRMKSFDDASYPMSMDRVVRALGAETVDWSYKTDCCGASLFITSEAASKRLVGKILKDAALRGADCICVACPMCHSNLDTKQAEIAAEAGVDRPLPVLFVTQLMGLAYGLTPSELKLADSFVPWASLGLDAA